MLDLTQTWFGYLSLAIFVAAYMLVVFEEATSLRKSKPVMLAAGLIWALIGMAYTARGLGTEGEARAFHTFADFAELFLFLVVAITYVNTLEERRIFAALRARLVNMRMSYRKLFWLTGLLSFFLSSALDNLTTSLVMGAVVLAIGVKSPRFVAIACINIVVAANAGGAFSPFGDITSLMVWQAGKLHFWEFFALFVPAFVNWLVPAAIMHFGVPHTTPETSEEHVRLKPGAWGVVLLFALTIATAISFRTFMHMPPALGMMLGLGYLQFFSYMLQRRSARTGDDDMLIHSFRQIEKVEWDTMLFFFGIIFAVSGLGVLGYLDLASTYLYAGWGPTVANIVIGALSAIVDNIPLMFAVLTMNPAMSDGQWLLITLTTGVGGSILSIGSAAGVALMGLAHGRYTFMSHLKWTWAIALGYLASIMMHFLVNRASF